MHCREQTELSAENYLARFLMKARRLHIPLSGSIEVTHACNLRCIHCYLGSDAKGRELRRGEMSSDRILSLIDEITEAGCLNLLVTGGEPLLRDDFPKIYRYAKEKGLLVTVFSNGTLLRNDIIDLFRALPPLLVEISLYGATASTYERVTGVQGSYEKCLRGIKALVANSVKISLKTVLMTVNSHELFAMERIAKEFGARFRFDAAISAGMGGERAPIELRVAPERAIEMEFSDEETIQRWGSFYEESKEHLLFDELYGCGAGLTSFHVGPNGCLQPCLMTGDVQHMLSGSGFAAAWSDIVSRLRSKKASPDFSCRGCEKINLCGYCPAFFRLENGAEDVPSQYICRMGELRYQRIKDYNSEGDNHDKKAGRKAQAPV